MTTAVIMPRLGETITEGMVVRWRKHEGEQVDRDEPVVDISTDKVDSEIPSPTSGKLAKILVPEGQTVPVDTKLAEIEEVGAQVTPPKAEAALAPGAPVEETPERPAPAVMTPEEKAQLLEAPPEGAPPRKVEAPQEGVVLSPLVRKLASERGVDLSQVTGTGSGGRITKQDVMKAAEARAAQVKAPAPPPAGKVTVEAMPEEVKAPGMPQMPTPSKAVGVGEERVPLGHIRKQIAEHMVSSHRQAAHVTAIVEVDMERIVKLRQPIKENFKRQEGFSLTYLPFVSRAAIEALWHFPTVNSELQDESLILKRYVNLGIAVAYEEGLIVPVIKGAEAMNVVGLARAINDVATRARARQLKPDEVHQGTFTITNPGTFGSIIQTPIINPPQSAILSLERIERRVVAVDDSIGIRHMVYLPLTYDHRVVDGALAAQFLSRVKENLEGWDFAPELADYAS